MKSILIYLLLIINLKAMEGPPNSEFYVIDVNNDEITDISKLIIQLYYQKEDCSGYHQIIPYVRKNFEKLKDSQESRQLVEELYRLNQTPTQRRFSASNPANLILNDFVHQIVKTSIEQALKSQDKTSESEKINTSNNKVKIAIVGAVVTLGTGITAAIVTLVIHFTS